MKSIKVTFLKGLGALGLVGIVLGLSSVFFSQAKANVVLPAVGITASPGSVCSGESTHLQWSSTDATVVEIQPGIGRVNPYGDRYVPLTQTTTFTITGSNSTSSTVATASVTVFVTGSCQQTPNPTVSLSADSTNLNFGGNTTIRWSSTNATSCNASGGTNGWSGLKATSGSFNTGSLTNSTTFSLTCTNSAGSDNDSVTINVANQVQNPSVSLSADNTNVSSNGSTTLRWSSSNATSCNASGGVNGWSGSKSLSGSFNTGGLTDTTTYSITCSNSSGSASDSVTVSVENQVQNPSVSLTADDTSIDSGNSTILRWSSNNATSCNASGGTNGWSGLKATSGSFTTGALSSDETYFISCSNSSGSASDSVTVNVNDNNNGEAPDVTTEDATNIGTTSATLNGSVDGNGSSTDVWFEWGTSRSNLSHTTSRDSMGSGSDDFDARISGLRSDTTYFFRAVAENDEGTDEGSILSFRTDDDNNNNNGDQPTVTTRSATDVSTSSATLRGEVDGNDSDTEVWFEWGRDRSDLSEETSREDTGSGSEEFDKHISGLRSDTTYYFRAMAENDEGTDEGSILSFRTDNSGNNSNDEGNITAVTTPATPVFSTSASLNSLILNPDNSSADAWFEWGTTLGLGNQTNRVPIGSSDSVRHTDTLTGLRAGTLYYFRAVAENSSERSVGSTLSFVTSGANIVQNPTTIVRNVTTVVNNGTGRNSLVTLTIDGGSEFITTNESREYHVTWKNISSQTLKNVVVRVLLPRSMTFAAASDGTFSDSDNALAFDIGTLSPNESGDLTLLARTGSILKDGELLVVVADLVYTNPAGVQDDVLAYATHKVYLPGSVLGASVFGAGFLPNSLFGWLLLLILLLILVLLIRYLSNPREVQRPVYTNTPPPPPSYL